MVVELLFSLVFVVVVAHLPEEDIFRCFSHFLTLLCIKILHRLIWRGERVGRELFAARINGDDDEMNFE